MVDATDSNSGRDGRGRFALGNPGGPGGVHRRSYELRRAVEEAITPEMASAMIRKVARLGLEGNLAAARIFFERLLGRPAEVPLEAVPLPIALPNLLTGSDCAAATQRVLDGVCKGTIDRETAAVLLDGIQIQLKSIEVNQVEQRLAELEKAAENVDFSGRNGR